MTALDRPCGWLNLADIKTVMHSNLKKSKRVAKPGMWLALHEDPRQTAYFPRPGMPKEVHMSRPQPDIGWFQEAQIFVKSIRAGSFFPVVPSKMS